MNPKSLMITGFALIALGWTALFLMVLGIMKSGIGISMVAYAVTVLGFGIGIGGVLAYRMRKGR